MFFLEYFDMLSGGALGALTVGLVTCYTWERGLPARLSLGPSQNFANAVERVMVIVSGKDWFNVCTHEGLKKNIIPQLTCCSLYTWPCDDRFCSYVVHHWAHTTCTLQPPVATFLWSLCPNPINTHTPRNHVPNVHLCGLCAGVELVHGAITICYYRYINHILLCTQQHHPQVLVGGLHWYANHNRHTTTSMWRISIVSPCTPMVPGNAAFYAVACPWQCRWLARYLCNAVVWSC